MIGEILKHNSELLNFIFKFNFIDRSAFDDTPYVNYTRVDSSTFRNYMSEIENEEQVHMFHCLTRMTYNISTDTISFGILDFYDTMNLGVPSEYAKLVATDYPFPITISNSRIFIDGNELTEELQFMLSTSEDVHMLFAELVKTLKRLEVLVRDEVQEFYKDIVQDRVQWLINNK